MVDYPENWDSIRKDVYRRDGWACQNCGATNVKVYAHHIVSLASGGSNELSNLITLCKNCHMSIHPHMVIGPMKDYIALLIVALMILYIFGVLVLALIIIGILVIYGLYHHLSSKRG